MRHPRSLLPALVAVVAGLIAGLMPVPASASASPSAQAARGDDPLQVTIDSLTPSTVPARGRVRMRGTVTNTSDERWRSINVHAFMAAEPMTSSTELSEAADVPVDAEVGDRITIPGTFDPIGSLDPGQTAEFAVSLRRDELPASAPGVYWFGAHALGNTDAARDGIADGRARTFLPLVPSTGQGSTEPLQASLVLPVRRTIRHRPNGRLRGPGRWARDLRTGGRLATLLDLATAEGAGPVTWLVDPAVPDAVARLVAGNPPRTLSDTIADPDDPDSEQPADPSGPASAEPVDGDEESGSQAAPNPAAEPGADWLGRLRPALAADDVLTLPYGDPDLAAVAANAPAFYDRAVSRQGTQLGRWETRTEPGVMSLSGYLSSAELGLLDRDETVIASEQSLPGDTPRDPARIDGHRVVFSSTATASGGPGPEDPLGAIAFRQRFLAEAALRLLFHDRAPLVVVVPARFRPDDPEQFWAGLDPAWLDLGGTDELETSGTLPADRLAYPVDEELTQLDAGAFEAAEELIGAGRTLQVLLTRNDRVAAQVLDEALTSVSYHERSRAVASRTETVQATQWIQTRLRNVRIQTPRGVTLSSDTGNFATTISNRLPHPVTVSLTAVGQGEVTVREPAPIQLAPRGRQTVLLEASATGPGVHYVRLMVTDVDGTPLGAAQQVPIRSAQVSQVIWLILGVGVGLLFLAIAIRVVRRVRSEPA